MSAFERLPLRRKLVAGLVVLAPLGLWFAALEAWVPLEAGMRYCPKNDRLRAERDGRVIVCSGRPAIYTLGRLVVFFAGLGAGHLYVRRAARSGRSPDGLTR